MSTTTFDIASTTAMLNAHVLDLFTGLGDIMLMIVPVAFVFVIVWFGLRRAKKAIYGKF